MPVSPHNREDTLIYCNEIDSKHFVVVATRTNLQAPCNAEIVLMDGTFKSCQNTFMLFYILIAFTRAFVTQCLRAFICIRVCVVLLQIQIRIQI